MLRIVTVCLAMTLVGGCANFNSIARTTQLPGDDSAKGVAIHLDAKQRVAVSKPFGVFCAEPSPDALSVAAASFGLGVAASGQGSGSGSLATAEGAASIGLRTQTITLMRDELYRICEMYYGKALNGSMVAQLHHRNQEVIVALLAIEQLTGAVTAQQAILGGSASSSASAAVGAVESALEAAKTREEEAKTNAAQARTEADAKRTEFNNAEEALANAKSNATTPQAETERLTTSRNTAHQAWQEAEGKARDAKAEADAQTAVRNNLEQVQNSAATAATASASTTGRFADAEKAMELSAEASKQVAEAISTIVKAFIEKDRTKERCALFLLDNREWKDLEGKPDKKEAFKAARDLCLAILKVDPTVS